MGWETPRTFIDGQLVPTTALNVDVRDNLNAIRWIAVHKTADETVANSATVQDDDHLFVPVGAGDVWSFQASVLYVPGASGGGFRWSWYGPTGSTGSWACGGKDVAGTIIASGAEGLAAELTDAQTSATQVAQLFYGTVAVGATAGNLLFRWAQNTSNAVATTVKTGSLLKAWRLVGG